MLNRQDVTHSKADLDTLLPIIFDKMDVAVVVADDDRRIVMANKAATDLFQYSQDELLGHRTSLLYASKAQFKEQGKKRFNPAATETSTHVTRYRKKKWFNLRG